MKPDHRDGVSKTLKQQSLEEIQVKNVNTAATKHSLCVIMAPLGSPVVPLV